MGFDDGSLMSPGPQRILHIGGSLSDAGAIREALAESPGEAYAVEWCGTLYDGMNSLVADRAGVVLLDVELAGESARDVMQALLQLAPDTPIVVVGTQDSEDTSRQIILAGADEYLVKGRLDGYWLPRALQHAIQRKLSETRSFGEMQRTELALNSFGDGFIIADLSGCVTSINAAAELMTGWSHGEAIGQPVEHVLQLLDGTTRESAAVRLDRVIEANQLPRIVSNSILMRQDGSESSVDHSITPIYDQLNRVIATGLVLRDITAAHAVSLQMSHLASHDALTDLPNRLLLTDRLGRALALAKRHHRQLAVLFLDIDRFKHINDSLGHIVGDELLRTVGRIVTMSVRSSDTVSRYGGDEFVAVLSELEHAEDAAVGARKIIAALAPPQHLLGHELHVTASIGISVYPDDGESAETLLRSADMALYEAKNQGKDCYKFFKPDLNGRALERQSIEAGLHAALERHEFELFYQPKINLRTNAVVGAEALIRWRHPDRGILVPPQFVRIAEDCGLIKPIGRWVVREACLQAKGWQDAGFRPIPVAVNVSAVEFRCPDFLSHIGSVLAETQLDPQYLEIEITESALMAHVDTTSFVLRSLKDIGVRLAIDDFGTGWSSLSYLNDFPIDTLKVDQSFVQAISPGSNAGSIVRAVISMGKSLKHRVIAEGVETRDQLAFLRAEECDEAQGFYFDRPLVAQHFPLVLDMPNSRIQSAGR
jgi:diguanylate cyclase (GGDEF)-like protein/PAS domain S-box-containing protein